MLSITIREKMRILLGRFGLEVGTPKRDLIQLDVGVEESVPCEWHVHYEVYPD